MTYAVKTKSFEGPLELLLELIEKQKLSINEISLAVIADDYVRHIKMVEQFRPEEVAAFLVIAATLMLIKSRSLLPNMQLTKEEETDIKELERRLELYRRFRALSQHIQGFQEEHRRMFSREAHRDFPVVFYPPQTFRITDMLALAKRIIAELPHHARALPEKTIEVVVSLEEKMEELRTRIEANIAGSFRAFTHSKRERIEIIVSFLALLELVKAGVMHARQEESFGDIMIQKT